MTASDHIDIRDLPVRCIIGVNPEERVRKQEVTIHLTLFGDFLRAGASDNIDDAINYATLTRAIVEHVEQSHYFLIERMAHKIAEIAVRDFGVARARVTVQKPEALPFTRSVGVTVERTAEDFDP